MDVDDDPNLQYYERQYEPALEVIDLDENIRAFLLSYSIPLSGKKEENRARLIHLANDQRLVLRWIDPKTGEALENRKTKQIEKDGTRKKVKKIKTVAA